MEGDVFTSVWEGSDSALLEKMFAFYADAAVPVEPILDSTANAGKMWKGSTRDVWTMDIDPTHSPDFCCDNRIMTGVSDAGYGVVVYDPPHVGNNGRDKSCKNFDGMYGANVECLKDQSYTLSFLYPPFLQQARRVLKPGGLLLAKITDQVNNHRSRWAHVDFMTMAAAGGFTVCDLIVKVRKGPMMSSKWQTMHHARKRHCFWIVCRNGHCCERR